MNKLKTDQEVQQFIAKMTDFLGIPAIPSRRVKQIQQGSKAMFQEWEIQYTSAGMTKKIIGHELGHYCDNLKVAVSTLEEIVADAVGEGLMIISKPGYNREKMELDQ